MASISNISFTGGEPFLLGPELDELVDRATTNGFHVSCNSNGYWAVNLAAARRRIRKLKFAGLRRVVFSTGEMHARFVPIDRVVNAAVASLEIGLDVGLSIEEFEGTTFDWRSVAMHPKLKPWRQAKRFQMFTHDWIPNFSGRGVAKLGHSSRLRRFRKGNQSACHLILDVLNVSPNLNLLACCGYPFESIPDLILGSVQDQTLADALSNAPNDILKLWMHVEGPERMLLFVKRHKPDYRLPAGAVDICQTCSHLFHDPIAVKILRDHVAEVEDDIVSRYLDMRRSTAN